MMASDATTPASAQTDHGPWSDYRANTRFGNLDGLRFLCITMVLWHHAQPLDVPGLLLLDRGFMGVDFFFVLSGYLITTLLLREAATQGSFSLRNFYIRRLLRIVPVYYFVVTMVAGYYIVIKGRSDLLELLPFYYLFLANFLTSDIPLLTPTWSLSVEEQYYMIWPLLMLLLPVRVLIPVCLLLIAGNVVLALGVFDITPLGAGPLLFKLPNATYAPIIMGSLAAILLHQRQSFDLIFRITGHWGAPLVTALGLIVALQVTPADVRGIPNVIIHTLMTLTLITLVVREKTVFTPFLTLPLVRRVGVISYGIYLYHLLALDLINRTLELAGVDNDWVVFVGYFILSGVIADLSFRTLEAWFQRFRPK